MALSDGRKRRGTVAVLSHTLVFTISFHAKMVNPGIVKYKYIIQYCQTTNLFAFVDKCIAFTIPRSLSWNGKLDERSRVRKVLG